MDCICYDPKWAAIPMMKTKAILILAHVPSRLKFDESRERAQMKENNNNRTGLGARAQLCSTNQPTIHPSSIAKVEPNRKFLFSTASFLLLPFPFRENKTKVGEI